MSADVVKLLDAHVKRVEARLDALDRRLDAIERRLTTSIATSRQPMPEGDPRSFHPTARDLSIKK